MGIYADGGSENTIIYNNIVEGFSGIGGVGIDTAAGGMITLYGHNAFFNCTTRLSQGADVIYDLTANDINPTAASPFTDAANDDFTVTTEVKALGYPTANYPGLAVRSYMDIGAFQRLEQGMLVHPGMGGGASG